MTSVKCTLWGTQAQNFSMDHIGQPVVIKQAYVGDYGGKNVSVGREGEILFSFRDDDRAKEVKKSAKYQFWYFERMVVKFWFFSLSNGGVQLRIKILRRCLRAARDPREMRIFKISTQCSKAKIWTATSLFISHSKEQVWDKKYLKPYAVGTSQFEWSNFNNSA